MKKSLFLGVLVAVAVAICWPGRNLTPQTTDPVLIGAGDIVDGLDLDLSGSTATAALIDAYPSATVFAAGDLPHNDGTDADYAKAYAPTWGRFRARTIPTPGNHDYNALWAAGYYNYFGPAAGDQLKGYYSLNLGTWHMIVLNSNNECNKIPCGAGSPQETWLKADLAANPTTCTLAMWHHPLYTSTSSTFIDHATYMQPIWQDLYNANVDLVVNGHAHNYERFAPQDANGNLNTAKGIIEIIAGTGGTSHFTFGSTAANSVIKNADTYGVLKLTLHPASFDWQFIPIAGKTFTDSGTQPCH
jgi:hypothetical protein